MDGKGKVIINWPPLGEVLHRGLCALLSEQKLVDCKIVCPNRVFGVHKHVLAARSIYFGEEMQKYTEIDQIVIQVPGIIMKSIIEFMYSGTTNYLQKHFEMFMSLGKLLKLKGLNYHNLENDYSSKIPLPIFLSKKRKYSSDAYVASASPYPTNPGPSVATDNNILSKLKKCKTINDVDGEDVAPESSIDNLRTPLESSTPSHDNDTYITEDPLKVKDIESEEKVVISETPRIDTIKTENIDDIENVKTDGEVEGFLGSKDQMLPLNDDLLMGVGTSKMNIPGDESVKEANIDGGEKRRNEMLFNYLFNETKPGKSFVNEFESFDKDIERFWNENQDQGAELFIPGELDVLYPENIVDEVAMPYSGCE